MKPFSLITAITGVLFYSLTRQVATQNHPAYPTENCAAAGPAAEKSQNVRLLFWNTENLFDYRDDTLMHDEEFTGKGSMHWTWAKFQAKIFKVAKVILAAGEWDAPGIIGFCEIENRYVLNRLIYGSPLEPFHYRVIHRDSPDPRGIDVALICRSGIFDPVQTRWIPVRFPSDTLLRTRDILYVKGLLLGIHTLHIFVNHWPSRRGGERESAPKRAVVAKTLRMCVDSIIQSELPVPDITSSAGHIPASPGHVPYIVIMGDFNDEPWDESLHDILGAIHPDSVRTHHDLVNLMLTMRSGEGSHKYRDSWGMLDQVIVSASLLHPPGTLHVTLPGARIFRPPFLMEDDLRYLGDKPRRTYTGPRYNGGISDHLPVMLDIIVKNH